MIFGHTLYGQTQILGGVQAGAVRPQDRNHARLAGFIFPKFLGRQIEHDIVFFVLAKHTFAQTLCNDIFALLINFGLVIIFVEFKTKQFIGLVKTIQHPLAHLLP